MMKVLVVWARKAMRLKSLLAHEGLSVPMCTQLICRFHCFEIVFMLLHDHDVASKTSHKEVEGGGECVMTY